MAGRRIGYLGVLLWSVVFYVLYKEWVAWLLLVAVAVLPWFSLLVSLPAMILTKIRIVCPATVPAGQEATVTLAAACPLPTPPIRGKLILERPLAGDRSKCPCPGKIPTGHCSGVICKGRKVWIYDYLGLFRHSVSSVEWGKTAVMPRPVPMDSQPLTREAAAVRFRPKPGGGFGENHDLRLYRPGDDLRQIHWKMSAKMGKPILREPLEPIRSRNLVIVSLSGDADALDRKLGQLLWLGNALLEQGTVFELHVLSGEGPAQFPVTAPEALHRALCSLLFLPPATEDYPGPEIPGARRFHIGGDGLEAD